LVVFEGYLNNFLSKKNISLNQNQFDALICFMYNLGPAYVVNSGYSMNTMLVNGISNYTDEEIKATFSLYTKAGGKVLSGLVNRRMAEGNLFLYGSGAYIYGYTAPESLVVGSSFSLKGTVASTSTIRSVTVGVYTSAGKTVLEKSDTPNNSYYNIATLDRYMTFGKLAVGSYNYRITITDKNGTVRVLDQCFSVTSNGSVPAAATLSAPTLSSVTIPSTGGIQLTWSQVDGADGYYIFRSVNGASASLLQTISSGSTKTYTDTAVKSGSSYTYTLYAFSGSTQSSGSSKSITYTAPQLATPKLVSVTSSSSGTTVQWEAVSGAVQYRVYYKTADSGWSCFAVTDDTTALHTSGVFGTTYYYTVRCVASDGTTFTSSFDKTGLSATYAGFFATPQLTSVTSSSSGTTVQWEAVPGAVQYRVYYKTANSGWSCFAVTDDTTALHTSGVFGTTYYYTVRCVDSDGTTFTSSFDKTGLSATYARLLDTPQLTSVTNSSAGVTVQWEAVPGAAQYRVYYKTGTGSWVRFAVTDGTSAVHTEAVSGKTYTYTVRCVSSDNKTFTSDFDRTGLSILHLSTPTVTVTSSSNRIRISWTATSGATSYRLYRRTAGGGWVRIANLTSTSYTDTTAKSGTTYYYTVRAVSGNTVSAFTSSAAIKR
jgi:fibronectin type 3 domain-containing protein